MITKTFYKTRQDGVNLYLIASDENKYIQIEGQKYKYENIIVVENDDNVFTETDIVVPNKSAVYRIKRTVEVNDDAEQNN